MTTKQLSDMEEGKKEIFTEKIDNSNIEIIIDKRDNIGDKYVNVNKFYTRLIRRQQSSCLSKCGKCYCDIEKDNKYYDNNIYYCSTCWYDEPLNSNMDSFIDKWGYDYEKVELD